MQKDLYLGIQKDPYLGIQKDPYLSIQKDAARGISAGYYGHTINRKT